MIGFLQGKVVERSDSQVIVDTRGVGYEVFVSLMFARKIGLGALVRLWIFTHVKQDQLQLFGFESLEEKQFFIELLKISGIGAKGAMQILSAAELSELKKLIASGDTANLSRLPKVGKKKASQIILAMKGKLEKLSPSITDVSEESASQKEQVIQALLGLGFVRSEVERAMPKVNFDEGVTAAVKQALEFLSNFRESRL